MTELIASFSEYLRDEKHTSENTRLSYERDLRKLQEFLASRGKKKVKDITEDDLSAYVDGLSQMGRKASTISRAIASMKAFFDFLKDNKKIKVNPATAIKAPHVEKTPPVVLTKDELDRLIKETMGDSDKEMRDRAMVEVLCATGMRVTELLSLKMSDIDFENSTLHVTGTGSHAAEPETGNNGITALVRLLLALPLADCPTTQALRDLDALLPHGDYRGRALGIAMEDDLSGYLTLSYTIMHLDEQGFEGYFDSRVPVCANEENCKAVVVQRFGRLGYAVEGEMVPSHHTPGDSPFVQTLLRCYERYTGQKGECLSMGGGTYVHDIEGGVAFGAGMPGFASNLHSANEHIRIQDMLTACKIFALVIAELCGE